jgi:hypothetical protein
MKRLKRFLGALLLACVGCVTPGPTPTPGPGPDVTDYSLVCQHLADLGCSEGKAPECAAAFGRIQGGRISDLQPSCLMAAKTPAAARACGSVLCE